MPGPLTQHLAALIGTCALASTCALAEDARGDKEQSKGPPTIKEKQRAVDSATRAAEKAGPGGAALGNRGPAKPDKTWDEMTPEEKEAARKRWLLNSGDFGPPAGSPGAAPPNPERTPKSPFIPGAPVRPAEKNPTK